jgi:hypothetical protein
MVAVIKSDDSLTRRDHQGSGVIPSIACHRFLHEPVRGIAGLPNFFSNEIDYQMII